MQPVQISLPPEVLPESHRDTPVQKSGLALFAVGLLIFLVGATGAFESIPVVYSVGSLGLGVAGALMYLVPLFALYQPGIRQNNIMFAGMTSRGTSAWLVAVAFTAFYTLLYFFPQTLVHVVRTVDPISYALLGKPADHWFLYSVLYTVAVLVMGIRMMAKYQHSRYQLIRTASVMFFQLVFAFTIPVLLRVLNQPEFYFTYFWPLKPDYLFPHDLTRFLSSDVAIVQFMGFWTIAITFIGVPVLTYFFGKRWYCSWVCGCGALAETLGDPYRHLSDKSRTAWRVEVGLIYSVLGFITVTTLLLWLDASTQNTLLGAWSSGFRTTYGFLIGSVFSGVIGVGFYPLMGSRVWCRFGCPQAAILGILQKTWSRFRITTNGGQCISCGNCSTYCEMGIDVRAYAQRGENIVRASCVGCGVCSSVCPRGVLSLENGPQNNRYDRKKERELFYGGGKKPHQS